MDLCHGVEGERSGLRTFPKVSHRAELWGRGRKAETPVGRRWLHTSRPRPISPLPLAAVKSIKKQHLVEVRSMANPPGAVKLALESICLLLGESTTDWKQIRSIIMRENFIPTIVNFSAEEIR